MKKSHFLSQDKTGHAFGLFLLIMLSDIFASATGFGGAWFLVMLFSSDNFMTDFMTYSYDSLIISVSAICLIFLTALHAYRNNQPKKLKAIATANIIMSLLPFVFNSVYYPFPDMLFHVIYRITDIEFFYTSSLSDYFSEFISVPMCVLCFVLLFKQKRRNEEGAEKVSFRRTVRVTVTVFALATAGGLAVCNILPSEAYNHSGIVYMAERAEAVIDGTMRKSRAEKIFDSITGDTEYSQAREMVKDNESVSVFSAESGKVKMKKITYVTASSYKTDESKEVFEMLKIGDAKDRTLKKMKKVSDISSYSVEYGENTVKEVYDFTAVNDVSFLHLVDITYFNATVVFENGILKDGNYTYATETNAHTDDVVCTEKKYTISE